MLASELAVELGVEPSVLSKHLSVYFTELGEERQRHLSETTVTDVREAHRLAKAGKAKSFKTAIQMVVGTYNEPVPSESVRQIAQRLAQLEEIQQQTLHKVEQVLRYLEAAMGQPIGESGQRVQL